jgi:hypothetical protein
MEEEEEEEAHDICKLRNGWSDILQPIFHGSWGTGNSTKNFLALLHVE